MDLAGTGSRDERDGHRDQPGRRRPARGARSADRRSPMSGAPPSPPAGPLLEIRNLTIRYRDGDRQITAVRDVSLSLKPGGSLAIVGESGSGKSSVAGAVLDFLGPTAEGTGSMLFDRDDIARLAAGPA